MSWLHSIDVAVFHFISSALSNSLFDQLMPFASGNSFFFPTLVLVGIGLIWKGGKRGRIFVLMQLLVVAAGDGWICNLIKEAVARPRPANEFPNILFLSGGGKAFSMPSSHAANLFAATMVAYLFYRRSWRFMLPLALLVGFSRIYNGAHYPSDVLAGAILGAGYGFAFVWLANKTWQFVGPRWFPIWWKNSPLLINPEQPLAPSDSAFRVPSSALDQHYLRLGYIFIFVLFIFRLFYLASPTIELSEDEAYQWVWSKHLAISYYSKPPLIAYTQWLGTTLWGDTEFGVRFFSPVIAAILSLLLLRFLARETNAKVGLAMFAILSVTPLTAVGSVLMTIDPLSVLFWTAAMLAGWRAVQNEGNTRNWLWVGLWMGLGFLSKYTNLFQLLCWIVFFLLWPPARKHLRRPGPYLALLIVAFSLTPVLVWNAQHGWITLEHVAHNGDFGKAWKPTLRYTAEFMGAELGLLNPIFFIGMLWATFAFWRRPNKTPLTVFLFSMGAPVFFFYFAYSFHSRILPNWIAPSVVPLFCLMAVYFHQQWPTRRRILQPLFLVGLIGGFFVVGLLHETDLTRKILKRTLPAQLDPLRRIRSWRDTAREVEKARQELSDDGKPAFIICDHYGITGEISFYLPENRKQIRENPFVFFRSSPHPKNQFYFWPGYESRQGDNAIFVQEVNLPRLRMDSVWAWLRGEKIPPPAASAPALAPKGIREQFTSVTDLGVTDILYGDRVLRRIRMFECRDLREVAK